MTHPAVRCLEMLEPMEATPASRPFTSPHWNFELTLGGHRMLAEFGEGRCTLHSRRHVDISDWFPEVSGALAALACGRAVLDGELCVLDDAGRNDPQLLHQRSLVRGEADTDLRTTYCVYDLLVHGGQDVRPLPWTQRQSLLRQLPLLPLQTVRLQRSVAAEGAWLHQQARALGRSGVVAKRCGAPYRAGRSADWLLIPSSSETLSA